MNFSNAQLQQLWIQYGGNPRAAPLAAAIALAESRGNPNATNTNTNGSTDRGLWQINSVHGSQSTYDIAANVRSAIAISNNGANWSPWSTYNSGAFRQFLTGRQTTAGAATGSTNPTSQALLGKSSTSGAAGSDLFGSHHSQLLYAGVWVGAVFLAIIAVYAGINNITGHQHKPIRPIPVPV